MFELPSSTKVERVFKIKELFKLIGADKEVKQEAQNIESIVMTNAISEQTTSLKPSKEVNEIYVIKLKLTNEKLPYEFIKLLDKSIHFQVLYEVFYNENVKYLMFYKGLGDKVVQYRLFETDWQKEELKQVEIVKDLTELYKLMLSGIANFKFRENEPLHDWFDRFNEVESLQKEFKKIDKQLKVEIQPKKKFELNDRLREIYKKIKELE